MTSYRLAEQLVLSMAERKDIQQRRFSLRELSQRAEQEIYKCLPLHSHPTEPTPQKEPSSSRKLSEPAEFLPLGRHARIANTQSLHSYQSQKGLQVGMRRQGEDLPPKPFTINTLSLKQLEPLKDKRLSLPKIKKRSPELCASRRAEIEWITPEEMMAMKLKMNRKQLPKIVKDVSRISLQKRCGKRIFNSIKYQITGWNIQEAAPQDLYD